MGRKAFAGTPEEFALRQRVLALRRRPRPTHSRGDKHAWATEFLKLYDAGGPSVMEESVTDYFRAFGLTMARVSELRVYMQVHAAAVQAGANPYHLRYIPVTVLYRLRHLMEQPNKLIEELLGKKAAKERKQKVRNRAARRRVRRKAAPSA